jgi:hypothetical protein
VRNQTSEKINWNEMDPKCNIMKDSSGILPTAGLFCSTGILDLNAYNFSSFSEENQKRVVRPWVAS